MKDNNRHALFVACTILCAVTFGAITALARSNEEHTRKSNLITAEELPDHKMTLLANSAGSLEETEASLDHKTKLLDNAVTSLDEAAARKPPEATADKRKLNALVKFNVMFVMWYVVVTLAPMAFVARP
jgi:hypothetical protein